MSIADNLESRAENIDVFLGFGIILMVMGHIGFGSIFDQFIHAFHMPMFFSSQVCSTKVIPEP